MFNNHLDISYYGSIQIITWMDLLFEWALRPSFMTVPL
jgi:hypothetical protein